VKRVMTSASLSHRSRWRISSGHRTSFALPKEGALEVDVIEAILGREDFVLLEDVLVLCSPMLLLEDVLIRQEKLMI
jgi:hypothetical protein